MLPKAIRDLKREAKKHSAGFKRVIKLLDDGMATDNPDKICVASAFYQILKHHMEEGDLQPDNISLATMLRGDSPMEKPNDNA